MSQARANDLFSFNDNGEAEWAEGTPVVETPVAQPRVSAKTADPIAVPARVNEQIDEQIDEPAAIRAPGRPRSEASRTAILDATRRLVSHTSVRDLSIEGIAKKAGVGKTTIYRWWPNKVAVVIEAFANQMDMTVAVSSHESTADAMMRHLDRLLRQLRGRNGKIIADLMAEAQSDPKVMAQFNEFYMAARRQDIYNLILSGQKGGVFNENMTTDIAVDIVLGPIFLRLMSGEDALDENFTSNYPQMAVAALET